MNCKTALVSLTAIFFVCATAFAQGTATIYGTVTDPTGLPVPAARVTVTLDQRGTTRTAETGASGGYVFPWLPIGTYSIRVEQQGFKLFERGGVSVNANENVRVDAGLEVGAISDKIVVTAEAPLVDSRSSVVGTLIDSRRVLDLPINGRNVIALAGLLPGVSQLDAPQTFARDSAGPTVSVSGSRGNQNLFLFDGAHFNGNFRNTGLNYPPPDALLEVKVLSNSFSAEYGRNAGSVFNVVTKSGSNELHGSAWEFLRNQALNARSFFAGSTKPQLVQNQFGAAAGGPIRRNKLFVFGSYEGLRVRPASLGTSAVPLTAAERAGTFSTAVRDPLTGQPFPNNQIPAGRIDTVAGNILSRNLMPLPNLPDGRLLTTYPVPQNNDSYLIRVDYNLGKHTIDGRFNENHAAETTTNGSVPSYLPLFREARVHSINLGDTFSLTPRLLNQARISFNRLPSIIETRNRVHLTDLGGNFPIIGDGRKIPPAISISGRLTLGNASNVDTADINESLQFSDAITWTRGSHNLRAGFDILKLRFLERSYYNTMGSFSFTGAFSGSPAADFLLGKAESMVVGSPVTEQEGLQTNFYSYVQDDWKVHRRLTVNFGLRYELSPPWVHPYDFMVTFHRGQQSQVIPSAPLGMVFPGDKGVPRGARETNKKNFAPRFGFAWDPLGNGRTSVRGAYGIFCETINADAFPSFVGQPFRSTFTVNAPFSLTDPLRGQAAIPLSFDPKNPRFVGVQELPFPNPAMRTPYVQHYHLTVQREVVKDLVVQAGYVGKLGRKLIMGVSVNPALFAPGATLANIDARRIIQPFGNLRTYRSEANSSYNALQVEANKRFSRGFSVQGAYTFSRSIDMASAISIGAVVPNIFDLSTQKGLSDFFAKHILSVSWIWDLPKLSSGNRLARAVTGGWQMNGLVSARTGLPIDILAGSDIALSGTPSQRPNVAGDPSLSDGRPRAEKVLAWFNRSAFTQPAAGTFGNVGRNALIGPASSTTNLGLFRNFALPGREGLRLQFRSEFFSVLNSPNFGNPETRVNAGARMGQITTAGGARVIQFALKMLF